MGDDCGFTKTTAQKEQLVSWNEEMKLGQLITFTHGEMTDKGHERQSKEIPS